MRTLIPTIQLLILLLATPMVTIADANVSKQQAVSIAQQNNPGGDSGRVLSIKQSGDVYRVKILNANGEVRIISVDVNNGKVVNR